MIVGTVVSLFRYPVKSMAAEAVPAADVSWHGLEGDRRWGFLRTGQDRNGFPWFTLRQRADLNSYRPVSGDPVVVRTPSGAEYEVSDPALAAELAVGVPVVAQKLDRGTFDSAPLSLVSSQTVDRLADLAGTAVDPVRFRPNIVVESVAGTPFVEDTWAGRTLRVGDALIRVDRRDKRCVVVNIDPATGERNSEVLRAVARHNDVTLGVYASVADPGRVTVGDKVELIDQPGAG